MAFFILLLVLSMSISIMFPSRANSQICPSICTCKWKSGKQTVECVKQGLLEIPSDLNPETQVIDLSQNQIEYLDDRAFQGKGLVNLQKIFMSNSGVFNISAEAFFQLSNLIELDLSGNDLTTIPSQSFGECRLLRRLQLMHNPIKYIPDSSLAILSQLTFLDLSYCIIEVIYPEAFRGLECLKTLKLEGNQLITIPVSALEFLVALTNLHLHYNPWDCDCRIREVREWMIDQNIPLSVPPHCTYPEQSKMLTWDIMALDDFACAPNVFSERPTRVNVVIGENASIECMVESSPKSVIYWELGGKSVTNISIDPELRGKYVVEIEGVQGTASQSSKLTIIHVIEDDAEVYTCIAENKAGYSSINFTLSVLFSYNMDSFWGSSQITILTIISLFVIVIALVVISVILFHPSWVSAGAKVRNMRIFRYFRRQAPETVEMTENPADKDDKDPKTTEKTPRQETGSSGYGSDQLTPDLVSRIGESAHGPSHSTSAATSSHPEPNSPVAEGFEPTPETWIEGRPNAERYDESPVRTVVSEIYPNPCFGNDDTQCFPMTSTATLRHLELQSDRYTPQGERVKTLRAGIESPGSSVTTDVVEEDPYLYGSWKRFPSTGASRYNLPMRTRFSPDEGYAEEGGLAGTQV